MKRYNITISEGIKKHLIECFNLINDHEDIFEEAFKHSAEIFYSPENVKRLCTLLKENKELRASFFNQDLNVLYFMGERVKQILRQTRIN